MSDVGSVKNTTSNSPDQYIEQLRQKIGTEFSDRKATGKKKNELGKDDFIKLMSAQLKHQDPLSPMKNEQMAAQLAQFSALEQMVNVNQNLEKMTAAQKPQENVLAASLIGKKIMTDSSRFVLQQGAQPELKFDLPGDAENVNVSVVDAKGEVIREFSLGTMARGPQSLRWDGKNSKNLDAVVGEYTYRVNAVDNNGKPLQINNTTAGLVSGVSFEGGKAMLLVDNKKIPMEAVGRIEANIPEQASSANSLTAKKSASVDNEKSTQQAKNNLPEELSPEKIKSMLSALGASSRTESAPEEAAVEGDGKIPDPLWNPANANL